MKTKATVNKVKWSGDGLVHLSPNSFYDPCETMCGNVDNVGTEYTSASGPVTCESCKHDLNVLKNGIVIN